MVERPDGEQERRRIPAGPYRALIAATNMKQRVRKLMEYTWADQLGYAVIGTPNLLEYDQGFFVKGGDGLADVKPIAASTRRRSTRWPGTSACPTSVAERPPTTETFSLPQTQEEFYFGHPYEPHGRAALGRRERHRRPRTWRRAPASPADEVGAAYDEIARKRTATAYLHASPVLLRPDGSPER